MTDRYKGFYVALENDVRDDDLEPLLNVVRSLKGVAAVSTPDLAMASASDWMLREQLRHQAYMAACEAVHEAIMGKPHPLAEARRKKP